MGAHVHSYPGISSTFRGPYIEPYVLKLHKALDTQHITLETVHTELGTGMIEMTIEPSWGLKSADDAFRFKRTATAIARQMNMEASFMSKPIIGETGNGMHYNHSLWSTDKSDNLCYDTAANALSDLTRHWVSGLIQHSVPLTAIYCPTVNCYRRLHRDWGPGKANWGIEG